MIVVGTTIAAFAMDREDAWASWMRNAEAIQAHAAAIGHEVRYFAAIEVDGRGLEPFGPFLDRLAAIGGEYWTYSLDDGRSEVTMTNRWRHITFGQNMNMDYCQANHDISHLLFVAADTMCSDDVMPRMLEMNHPIVAPFIDTYGLRGPVVPEYPYHVESAMASAAAIFMAREVFRLIRWRWDLDAGSSDDPCFYHDTQTYLGIPTYVRHDVKAEHFPRCIGPYDTRFDPESLKVQW